MTEQNLPKAFAGESQARNRDELYVKAAREEDYEQMALPVSIPRPVCRRERRIIRDEYVPFLVEGQRILNT